MADEAEDIAAEIPIGPIGRSEGRTLTDGECGVLSSLTWTIGDIHTNRELGKLTEFGDVILGGPIVIAVAAGLFSTSISYRSFRAKYRIKMIAALGLEATFLSPFLPGDTMWVDTSIESARMSRSRPGAAVILFVDEVINQRDETILKMKRTRLMTRDQSIQQ